MTWGIFSLPTKDHTDFIETKKNDTERCLIPAHWDVTFPCELRLHQAKYLAVANEIIQTKYPTTHKEFPGTQLGLASIDRGVLQTIAQVADLACHRVLSMYHISGYFLLLTEIITNKIP